MSNKKIVVFGGGGFIGSYVVEELLRRKYNVIYADLNPSSFLPQNLFKKCDVLSFESVNDIIDNETDIVYNFAAFSNLDESIHYPKKTIELNVIGNINILNACKEKNIDRYIYASSAYAMSAKGSFYGISKLTSEKVIEEYNNLFNLKFTIVRYGSVYSERPSNNNYIYNLIKEILLTNKVTHKGDGEEYREYIHAADTAKLSVDIIEDQKYVNQHLMLTGVEKMKRVDLFNMIKEIIKDDTITIELNNSGYDHHYKYTPYSFQPMFSKKLVANPFIDMGQGLLECIKSINDYLVNGT